MLALLEVLSKDMPYHCLRPLNLFLGDNDTVFRNPLFVNTIDQ